MFGEGVPESGISDSPQYTYKFKKTHFRYLYHSVIPELGEECVSINSENADRPGHNVFRTAFDRVQKIVFGFYLNLFMGPFLIVCKVEQKKTQYDAEV